MEEGSRKEGVGKAERNITTKQMRMGTRCEWGGGWYVLWRDLGGMVRIFDRSVVLLLLYEASLGEEGR